MICIIIFHVFLLALISSTIHSLLLRLLAGNLHILDLTLPKSRGCGPSHTPLSWRRLNCFALLSINIFRIIYQISSSIAQTLTNIFPFWRRIADLIWYWHMCTIVSFLFRIISDDHALWQWLIFIIETACRFGTAAIIREHWSF